VTAAPWPRAPLQTGWGHIGATLGPQTITSERTTPDANGSASFQHTDQTWPSAPGRQRGVAAARSAAWAPPYPLGPAGHRLPSGQPARIRSGTAGTPRRLLSWSFSRSFHRPQLQPTRAHWPESQPNLSWLDPTGTSSAEYRQLSPKQQVAGSSPARGTQVRITTGQAPRNGPSASDQACRHALHSAQPADNFALWLTHRMLHRCACGRIHSVQRLAHARHRRSVPASSRQLCERGHPLRRAIGKAPDRLLVPVVAGRGAW
jgi:hypothetical protein